MRSLLLAAVVAFRGATLIDGTGAPPRENTLVVVADGRIVSAGLATPDALARLPSGATVVDVSGKWIVPGLIDAHVHAESDQELGTMLRWGVTSVRLMSEDAGAAARLAAESRTRTDIPEVVPASPIFTARGGWWDQGQPLDPAINRFPATPDEAQSAVRRARQLGSSEIKLMLDDMAWCRSPKPPLPRMRADVAKALIEEARAARLRVSVHAPNLADAKEAIADGATVLAHGVLEPLDAETIAVMKERPVFYVPTMDIFEFLAETHAFVEDVLSDRRCSADVHGRPTARYESDRTPEYAEGYRRRYPNFENVKAHLPALRQNLRALDAAGVPIALGTDMWAFPGLGVTIEMNLYVRAGLSPLAAIRAATQTSARSLDLDRDRGTLEPGKRADFLVLNEDPVRDVKNLRAIDAVYRSGRRVGPGAQGRAPSLASAP